MATNCLDVYIKMPTGRNIQLNMLSNQTIDALCEEIGSKEDIEKVRIRLKYQGKVLTRTLTLGYLGVQSETILKAEIIDIHQVCFKIQEAEKIREISIRNIDTITDLINEIKKETNLDNKTLQTVQSSTVSASSYTLVDEFCQAHGFTLTVKDKPRDLHPSQPDIINEEVADEIKSSFDSQGRNVEVAFSFDTTGSMYSVLDTVRQKLKTTCERLLADIPNIRISLIAHGDYCDQNKYVIRIKDLTSDVQELVTFAENVPQTGGGDEPECYEWVLKKAQTLDWAENSAKALVVIGDSPPHGKRYTDQNINWHEELDILTGMGVKVYGVQAYGRQGSKPFYQELADRSGGCYLPLQYFDAITDMFLAVCYHEADDNQLDDFVKEIEDAGEMTSAKKEMFDHLKTSVKPKSKMSNKIQHNYPWWNNPNTESRESRSFQYDIQTDKWSQFINVSPSVPRVSAPISMSTTTTESLNRSSRIRHSIRKKVNRVSCVVM